MTYDIQTDTFKSASQLEINARMSSR